MITKVSYHNFKALQSVRIADLQRLNVIVGPNGSGKTSMLEGIFYLTQLLERSFDEVFGGPRAAATLQCSASIGDIEVHCALADNSGLLLRAHPVSISSPPPVDVAAIADSSDFDDWLLGYTDEERQPKLLSEMSDVSRDHLIRRFPRAVLLNFDGSRLAAPSYSEDPIPRVASNGDGLASVLAYMKVEQPDDFDAICDGLREIVPHIRSIRPQRAQVVRTETQILSVGKEKIPVREERSYWGHGLAFDTDAAADLPAHLMSEGTLLALGLLTVILGPAKPRLVLLEDIERALHPRAQQALVELIRKIHKQRKDLQIIATSHSPYLLDYFEYKEVLLTRLNESGAVVCGRLNDHPEFGRWKDVMAPGEFWSMVGEDWIGQTVTAKAQP